MSIATVLIPCCSQGTGGTVSLLSPHSLAAFSQFTFLTGGVETGLASGTGKGALGEMSHPGTAGCCGTTGVHLAMAWPAGCEG